MEEPVRIPEQSFTHGTSTDTAITSEPGTPSDTGAKRTRRSASSGEETVSRTARTGSAESSDEDTSNATVLEPEGTVRIRPDESIDIVEVLSEGDRVTITGDMVEIQGEHWYPVTTSTGNDGWMIDSEIQLDA